MTQLHLELDPELLTFDDMIDITDGKLRRAKEIITRFAVDADGKPLEAETADALVGALNIGQMRAIFAELNEQIGAALNDTLPKAPAPKSRRR